MCTGKLLGIRHLQVVLLFFSLFLCFSMRVNMSLAVVAMTDGRDPDYIQWNFKTQSVVLSAFFWGYIVLEIPGSELVNRFGAANTILIIMAINCIMTMLIPVAAQKEGWKSVCGCRAIQGLSQGPMFSAVHSLLAKWSPMKEECRLISFVYAGMYLGTALQLMASGFISEYLGWPAIFYINGCLSGLWVAIFIFLGADSPEKSKFISDAEKEYIQTTSREGQFGRRKRVKTPWKEIATNWPFYAVIACHAGHNWSVWTLFTEMPSYLKVALNVDMKSNGAMSAIPYLAHYVLSFPFGFMSNYFLKKKCCQLITVRKVCNCIGTFGSAMALIALCHVPPDNVLLTVITLAMVVGFGAGTLSGFLLVHIDLFPNFAGMLMAISSCIANITGIAAPLTVGTILKDETDPKQWHEVFYIASTIYFTVTVFFIIFASAEKQPWDEVVEVQPTADNEIENHARSN